MLLRRCTGPALRSLRVRPLNRVVLRLMNSTITGTDAAKDVKTEAPKLYVPVDDNEEKGAAAELLEDTLETTDDDDPNDDLDIEATIEDDLLDEDDDHRREVMALSPEGQQRYDEMRGRLGQLEVGMWYPARVIATMRYGAMVQTENGTQGLVHISQISDEFVHRVEDVMQVGDVVNVRFLAGDDLRKVSFSMRRGDHVECSENPRACAVFRIPYHWTRQRVSEALSARFGKVLYVDPRNSRKDDERIVTFVVFANAEDAEKCASELPGLRLDDDPLIDDQGHPVPRMTPRLGAKVVDDYTQEFLQRFADKKPK